MGTPVELTKVEFIPPIVEGDVNFLAYTTLVPKPPPAALEGVESYIEFSCDLPPAIFWF
jgi:hypothetical protein